MSVQFPQHAAQPFFAIDPERDCLLIDGLTIHEIAQRVGRTPFYAYSRSAIAARVEQLRRSLPADIHVHYAVKANPMPAVVQFMGSRIDGFDVASAGELRVGLEAGMSPEKISFAGPGKSDADLSAAVHAGITVSLESPGEMRRLAKLADATGRRPSVLIRVNPDFELKTSGMKMGGGPKQFGIDAELVPGVLTELARLPLDFRGFHIFSGSQNLRTDAIIEAHTRTFELAVRLADHVPQAVRLLNIGGGFGIPYFPGEQPLDLAPIGRNLRLLLERYRSKFPQAEILIELGRFLVGEAGVYVCRVLDRKESRGQTFLVTDGGLHHHLAASGNFGQVIRKNYPQLIATRVAAAPREVVTVVGPLCTPLDLLGDRVQLSRADVGDLVAVFQSGAYGLSASPTAFLSHPPPGEILV